MVVSTQSLRVHNNFDLRACCTDSIFVEPHHYLFSLCAMWVWMCACERVEEESGVPLLGSALALTPIHLLQPPCTTICASVHECVCVLARNSIEN